MDLNFNYISFEVEKKNTRKQFILDLSKKDNEKKLEIFWNLGNYESVKNTRLLEKKIKHRKIVKDFLRVV